MFKFNNEILKAMAKEMEELYNTGVRVESVFPFPETRDVVFQAASGGKIVVSEKDDGKFSSLRLNNVRKVELVQHGIWDVTFQSGEKLRRNVLTHE